MKKYLSYMIFYSQYIYNMKISYMIFYSQYIYNMKIIIKLHDFLFTAIYLSYEDHKQRFRSVLYLCYEILYMYKK